MFVLVLLAIFAHLESSKLGGTLDVETIPVVPDLGGAADVDVSAGIRNGLAGLEVCLFLGKALKHDHEAQRELGSCSKHPPLGMA